MSRLGQPHRISGFGLRPSFGLRSSDFGFPLRMLLSGLVLALALHPASLRACAACYGQSDSPMAAGMNWGILSLLVVIGVVLGGVSAFFIYLAKRSARAPLPPSTDAALPHDRSAPVLGRSNEHKHLGLGTLQPVGRVEHRCARGRAHSDTLVFSNGMRQVVPGSSHTIL
jgi:hypothetical protein